MKIVVVGSGKLANAILSSDLSSYPGEVIPWNVAYTTTLNEKSIIVHAGSGRQVNECVDFCKRTDSIFVELSTGLETERLDPDFTLVICPNTSILLLKMMRIVKTFGHYFQNDKILITESHQQSKTSVPGTAFNFAQSLNFPVDQIKSIRDQQTQLNEIGIEPDYLDRHAYHKIVIQDGLDTLTIETKVLGHNAYAAGVARIVELILNRRLEKRKYSVIDLLDNE